MCRRYTRGTNELLIEADRLQGWKCEHTFMCR